MMICTAHQEQENSQMETSITRMRCTNAFYIQSPRLHNPPVLGIPQSLLISSFSCHVSIQEQQSE